MVDRAKARMVAMGYSQTERVDYFETFASAVSATSRRLVAAMSCKLDWVGPEALRCRPGFHSVGIGRRYLSASAPRLWISIWEGSAPQQGPLRPGAEWSNEVSTTVVNPRGVWFRACLVDPCVFRLVVAGDVAAIMVFHVNGINIASTKEVTDVIVSALNQRFPTKHIGEVGWYMESECNRDREKGALEVSQLALWFIRSVLNRFDVSKPSPILATPPFDLAQVSEEETVVGVSFREIVGSLTWIANQKRSDIANAVPAIARFSHDLKPIHCKAAQKILEYLNATSDLVLTVRRDDYLGSAHFGVSSGELRRRGLCPQGGGQTCRFWCSRLLRGYASFLFCFGYVGLRSAPLYLPLRRDM